MKNALSAIIAIAFLATSAANAFALEPSADVSLHEAAGEFLGETAVAAILNGEISKSKAEKAKLATITKCWPKMKDFTNAGGGMNFTCVKEDGYIVATVAFDIRMKDVLGAPSTVEGWCSDISHARKGRKVELNMQCYDGGKAKDVTGILGAPKFM